MARIIDLDAALPKDLAVRIDGKTYPLPSDIPVPDYLAISRAVDELRTAQQEARGEDAAQLLEDLYERVLELFRIRKPDLEDLPIGPQRLGLLVTKLYGDAADEDEADEPRPTKPRARTSGTQSTSRKKPTRSRSRK